MSLDEVQVAMQKQPRRVIMDVYTDWCGWCKVMDRKTFTNPELIDYVNKNFYAVKFNAETPDSIRFGGRMWGPAPGNKANSLAVEMVRGQLSYPTTVILEPGLSKSAAHSRLLGCAYNGSDSALFCRRPIQAENHFCGLPEEL